MSSNFTIKFFSSFLLLLISVFLSAQHGSGGAGGVGFGLIFIPLFVLVIGTIVIANIAALYKARRKLNIIGLVLSILLFIFVIQSVIDSNPEWSIIIPILLVLFLSIVHLLYKTFIRKI